VRLLLAPRLVVAALFCLTFAKTPVAGAVPIQGKLGLGVDTGDLISSEAEAALIWGRSESTAWLFLINVRGAVSDADIIRDYAVPDTTVASGDGYDSFYLSAGPGLRKFVRPSATFAPYFDVTLRGIRSVATDQADGGSTYSTGGRHTVWAVESGLAIGAEYFFEKWPVSLAAHADLVTVQYRHRFTRYTSSSQRLQAEENAFSASGGLGPRLQVRVYF